MIHRDVASHEQIMMLKSYILEVSIAAGSVKLIQCQRSHGCELVPVAVLVGVKK